VKLLLFKILQQQKESHPGNDKNPQHMVRQGVAMRGGATRGKAELCIGKQGKVIFFKE
jgi:hypothetical protein